MVPDEEALVEVRGSVGGSGRPLVRVFTSSGQLTGSVLWEGSRLADWGWSNELQLVMVDSQAKVGGGQPAPHCSACKGHQHPKPSWTAAGCICSSADQ